ncbi:MAG: NUDIX hydrolase [Candidatus Zixiibacteriota bacterium]|nr:MAG: NUDIX hydrolase [candidate division Zixibacteria bacterium]
MSIPDEHKLIEARDFKYCPWCGSRLESRRLDGVMRSACPSCEYIWYKNPIPATGAIIVDDNRVLLVKRKYPPKVGDWCIPAGFMEYDESPVECCKREVKEETGLDIKIERLFWNYKAGDDPRSIVVLILYLASVIDGDLLPGDDALETKYFDLERLPSNIAFSAHRRAIKDLKKYLEDGELPRENEP